MTHVHPEAVEIGQCILVQNVGIASFHIGIVTHVERDDDGVAVIDYTTDPVWDRRRRPSVEYWARPDQILQIY